MVDRNALRFLLSRFVHHSQSLTMPGIREVKALVSSVTVRMLAVDLPEPSETILSHKSSMYCEVYEAPQIHASIFGLRAVGDVIPLHNHPRMHGFIKVIRGSFEITSFSWAETPNENFRIGQSYPVTYEGTRVLTPDNDAVYLSPLKGNMHQIRAIENGSYFFDLLVPGYKNRMCSYFRMPSKLPLMGEKTEVVSIPQPLSFECAQIYYDPIRNL